MKRNRSTTPKIRQDKPAVVLHRFTVKYIKFIGEHVKSLLINRYLAENANNDKPIFRSHIEPKLVNKDMSFTGFVKNMVMFKVRYLRIKVCIVSEDNRYVELEETMIGDRDVLEKANGYNPKPC